MLEELIRDLTAAIRENTAAVNQCIATAGGSPATPAPLAALPDPVPAKAPAKGKAKAAAAPEPEAPAAEPAPEPEAPASTFPTDRAAALLLVQDHVRGLLVNATDKEAVKAKYAALIAATDPKAKKVSELADELLEGFYAEVCKL